MPDRNARHSKSKWEWFEPGQARSGLKSKAVNDDPASTVTPAKKKRGECKQNQWGPHEFAIIEDPNRTQFPHQHTQNCHWAAGWSYENGDYRPVWKCHHAELCMHCGKRKKESFQLKKEECPEYTPDIPAGVVEAAADEQEKYANRTVHWYFRQKRQPITGPQGYRKKR